MSASLCFRAPAQQRVPHHLDAEVVLWSAGGDTRAGELLGQHQLLDARAPAASVLGWPRQRQVAVFEQKPTPRVDVGLEFDGLVAVLGEEGAHLAPERLRVLGIAQIHDQADGVTRRRATLRRFRA